MKYLFLSFLTIALLHPMLSQVTGRLTYIEAVNLNNVTLEEGELDDNIFQLLFSAQKARYDYAGGGPAHKKIGSFEQRNEDKLDRRFVFYQDRKKHELISQEFNYGGPHLIQEKWPDIPWTIQQEEKIIAELLCKKATAHFRGRDYTAWFTPELPFNFGPWKLCGLPGLILEAYDATGQVAYWFHSLTFPLPADSPILAPSEGKRVSVLERDEIIKTVSQKRLMMLKARLGSNVSIELVGGKVNRIELSFEDLSP
ncbi:MAG: GLPGLI family protein [Bacteroidota bacterium]